MAILSENFTLPELRSFIRKKLGGAVWKLEGMDLTKSDTIDQGVSEALHAYSRRVPLQKWRAISVFPSQKDYALSEPGYGVARCDFIYLNLVVSPFLSSLIGVSPVLNLEGRDLDTFTRWRKSFMRVTSADPHWHWDEAIPDRIMVNSPSHNVAVGVLTYNPRSFDQIRLVHKDWIRRASVANCRMILAENRRKFGDKIPSPGGAIQLNGQTLYDEAKSDIEKLEAELFGFQTKPVILFS